MYMAKVQILGSLYMTKPDYARAEMWFDKALELMEAAYGKDNYQLAGVLMSVAWMHKLRGDLPRAAKTFQEVIRIYAASGIASFASTRAVYTQMLAEVYDDMGPEKEADAKAAWAEASEIYESELAKAEATHGPDHSSTLVSVGSLASHLKARGDLAGARELYERQLRSNEKQHGKKSTQLLGPVMNLAYVVEEMGDLKAARKLHERALALQKRNLGKVTSVSMELPLITLDEKEQKWRSADKRQTRVLAVYETAYGEQHPAVAPLMVRLGFIKWARGKVLDAVRLIARSQEIVEPHLRVLLQTGTERDRRAVLERYAYHMDAAVALDRTLTRY